MATDLVKKKCVPCEKKDLKPFSKEEALLQMDFLPNWLLGADSKKISREYVFPNFVKAVDFIDQVADIAEVEGHHPDIFIAYNKVKLELWTHSIGGLSENDFILAAKIDDMLSLLGSIKN